MSEANLGLPAPAPEPEPDPMPSTGFGEVDDFELPMLEPDLCQAGPRAGREKTQVAGQLAQADGQSLKRRAGFKGSPGILHESEPIPRRDEGQSGPLCDIFNGEAGVIGVGVDPGPHSIAPEADPVKIGQHLLQVFHRFFQGGRISLEVLAQPHRHGILQVGPSRLDDG